jgi:hypothetical protein
LVAGFLLPSPFTRAPRLPVAFLPQAGVGQRDEDRLQFRAEAGRKSDRQTIVRSTIELAHDTGRHVTVGGTGALAVLGRLRDLAVVLPLTTPSASRFLPAA